MHRDLKLANILIHFPGLSREQATGANFSLKDYVGSVNILPGPNGEKPVDIVIKIADLGFARKLDEGQLA